MKLRAKIVALLSVAYLFVASSIYNLAEENLQWNYASEKNSSLSVDLLMKKAVPAATENSHIENSKRHRKKILIYTSLFGSFPWRHIPYNYKFTNDDGAPCPVSDCEVTYDKSQLYSSDVVVFHGRDLPDISHMKSIQRAERPLSQQWIFLMHESPMHSHFSAPSLNGIFNLTATYRSDSDIMITYWFYEPLQGRDPRPEVSHNFARGTEELHHQSNSGILHLRLIDKNKEVSLLLCTSTSYTWVPEAMRATGKTKLASWLNSHCDDDRIDFVRKLRKHVSIDVYGGCSKHFDPNIRKCPRNSKTCKDIQSEYKFFLAIENSFCIDYITEKYWLNSLEAGLVPVVLGLGNYSNSRLAIPGSYIDASKFVSIKDLAMYLEYVNYNDDVYNSYHQWRYKYKLKSHNFMCLICDAIQSYNIPPKTVDMGKFWGKQTCDQSKKILKHFIATA